jgi:hypothetical protein
LALYLFAPMVKREVEHYVATIREQEQ